MENVFIGIHGSRRSNISSAGLPLPSCWISFFSVSVLHIMRHALPAPNRLPQKYRTVSSSEKPRMFTGIARYIGSMTPVRKQTVEVG